MLTNARRSQSLPRNTEQSFVARRLRSNNRLSLRPCDAPIGAAALGSIASGVLMIHVAESFGGQRRVANVALSMVVLLFAPAMLGAIYSLIFEKSKVYSCFDLALAATWLRLLPFTRYWIGMYLPFACAFAAFCAVVRWLQLRQQR
jgi:hypothetical protein